MRRDNTEILQVLKKISEEMVRVVPVQKREPNQVWPPLETTEK